MEILREVYQEFKLENIKFSKFSNVMKNLKCDDTNQFSLNFQCVKLNTLIGKFFERNWNKPYMKYLRNYKTFIINNFTCSDKRFDKRIFLR